MKAEKISNALKGHEVSENEREKIRNTLKKYNEQSSSNDDIFIYPILPSKTSAFI